jgi:thiol-disulfide isomerase/thioredoxin
MKKLLILFSMIAISLAAKAQDTANNKKRIANENRVVVDSAGTRYPYVVWKKLVTSRDYRLKKINKNSDTSAYLLIRLDSAQKDRRLAIMPKPKESIFFTEGEQIKLFNASDINNYKIKWKELAGKVVVLNFWFIGCPPCRKEIPELNDIALQYANDPNIVFIAVALDQAADIRSFIKDNPFSYHIVDDGRNYADNYRIHLFPTNVVVGKDGKIRFHSSGYQVNTAYWIKKTIEEAKSQ